MKMRAGMAISVACLTLTSCGSGSTNTAGGVEQLKLGALLAETGSGSSYGQGDLTGLQLAVAEIHSEGGFSVGGKKYEFVLNDQDYASQGPQAVSVAQKLLTQDNVKILVGPDLSLAWTPAWGVIGKENVINATGATAATKYLNTNSAAHLFSIAPLPTTRAKDEIAVGVASIHPKTAAILAPDDPTGKMYEGVFKQGLVAAGVNVVFDQTFPVAQRDFTAQLTAMRPMKPDVLITGYLNDVMSTVMRQAVELGVTKNFISIPGPTGEPGTGLGNQIDHYFWSIHTLNLTGASDAAAQTYVASFKKHLQKEPDGNAYQGVAYHDFVWLVVAGMIKAGTVTDLAKVSEAMKGVSTYRHSSLNMKLDATGQAFYPSTVVTYTGATGKSTYTQGS
jgi:branched-chain amino acid transport system substrate-binding protein